jgi:hypothetical protein
LKGNKKSYIKNAVAKGETANKPWGDLLIWSEKFEQNKSEMMTKEKQLIEGRREREREKQRENG